MPRVLKRLAPTDRDSPSADSSDDDDVRPAGGRNQRRRQHARDSPASDENDDDDARSQGYKSETLLEDDASAARRGESVRSQAQKLVRYALSCEYSRTPIRRADVVGKVLAAGQGRAFRAVFSAAQDLLGEVFGMAMEELPMRERVTNAQKRAAQRSEKQSTSSNAWVLVSTLPAKYREPQVVPPARIPTATEEAQYAGLYTFFIALIYLHQDRLPESKLEMQLRKLNLEQNSPLGPTEKLLRRMEKDGYIVRKKDSATGEELVEYMVGPRGKVEVDREAAAGFIRAVYGQHAAEDFEQRLEKSLRRDAPMPLPSQTQSGLPEASRRRGRPRRNKTESGEDDEKEEVEDGENSELEED